MNLLEILTNQLGDQQVDEMGRKVGAQDKGQLMGALGQAVPVIMGALARNTRSDEGAQSLNGALDRDHDGSILDNLGSLFSNPDEGAGNGILKHILGEKRPMVEQQVSEKSGMDLGSVSRLLVTVAPIVLGMIGKKKRESNMDASGLAGMMAQAAGTHESDDQGGSGMGGFVSSLLDRDGDGNVMDDIGGMIGGLFGR